MSLVNSVSIIGRGGFGKLLAELIPDDVEVGLYGSKDTVENITSIGSSDVIFLAMPLQAYSDVLKKLRPALKPETLIVDLCSVKVKPAEYIREYLPDHQNVLLTHPLFGPQSYHNKQKKVLVVTAGENAKAKRVIQFCEQKLKLTILMMSNEAHDQRMAEIHVLTFFIARALQQLELHSEPFMTPSFQSLLDLAALDATHTDALFETIQNGNPFAAEERANFIKTLQEIDKDLSSNT